MTVSTLASAWAKFGFCVLLIAIAGTRLSRYGDVIAEKTGLSGNWIGLILLATATSLPELITGVSAVTVAETPNIAIGDALGSCIFNLAILFLVDLLHRSESLYRRASQGHLLSAAFGIVLIGLVGLSLLTREQGYALRFGHVGVYSPVIAVLYLAAMRSIFLYERSTVSEFVEEVTDRHPGVTLRRATVHYAVAASVIVAAGIWMPFIAAELADAMGWNKSFVGTLLVAAATSMPELAVTMGALGIGALDMAIANLLGSNLFDILIIAIDDVFFLPAPILSHVPPIHAASAVSAMIMTGLAMIGLFARTGSRLFGTVGWVSLGLLAVYLLNSLGLYLAGD